MTKMIHYMLIFGILFLFACTSEDTDKTDETVSTPVHVMEVQKVQKQEQYNLIGTFEINREMKVGFKLAGKITHLGFEEGQQIQAGSLLAQLDTAELLAQKEKVLETLTKAERDLKRMKKLYKQKIVSESSLEDAQSAYNLSNAELKIVEDALKNSSIKAPFKGRIIKKYSEEGEVVGPGTVIALLAEMDPILVKAAIPDHLIPKINIGDFAVIKVDWDPHERFSGTIHRMESIADPVTRTIRIEILVPNPDEVLKPGLMAQVEISHLEKESRIYLPLDAVIGFGRKPFIFIIQERKAEKREIKTGKVIGEEVEVVEGLVPGETVVISGQEYLRDKQIVIIKGKSGPN